MQRVILNAVLVATLTCLSGGARAVLVSANGGTLVNDTTSHLTWVSDMNLMGAQQAYYNDPTGQGLHSYEYVMRIIFLGGNNDFGKGPKFGPSNGMVNALDFNGSREQGYSGRMNWFAANAWINYLNKESFDGGETVGYEGYTDWRLPSTVDENSSFGFADGATGNPSIDSSELANLSFRELGMSPTGYLPDNYNSSLFSNKNIGDTWSGTTHYYFGSPSFYDTYAWTFGGGQQNTAIKSDRSLFATAVRSGDVLSPIPEPETYALMLAGLAVVGAAAKRKARRAQ